MDVSIIIVNYNTQELTSSCIDSICEQTIGLEYEIIVVDNNSQDNSRKILSEDKRIMFVESGENLGFGRANNLGLQKATGEYVFFLNSDTYLLNNAVKEFYDFIEQNCVKLKIGALGCILKGTDLQQTHSYAKFPNAWRTIRDILTDHIIKRFGYKSVMKLDDGAKENAGYFRVDYITGADLFVSRKMLEKFGVFDPDFFMYYEETEMQFRWTKCGFFNYIIKTPQIVHVEGGSQKQEVSFPKKMRQMKSQLLYFRKTMSYFMYGIFRVLYFFCHVHLLFIGPLAKGQRKELRNVLLH